MKKWLITLSIITCLALSLSVPCLIKNYNLNKTVKEYAKFFNNQDKEMAGVMKDMIQSDKDLMKMILLSQISQINSNKLGLSLHPEWIKTSRGKKHLEEMKILEKDLEEQLKETEQNTSSFDYQEFLD